MIIIVHPIENTTHSQMSFRKMYNKISEIYEMIIIIIILVTTFSYHILSQIEIDRMVGKMGFAKATAKRWGNELKSAEWWHMQV